MGLDPSALSLMLRGKRKITIEECAQLAVLLDVSTTEVLERAGLQVHGERKVKLVGYVNSQFEVTLLGDGAHEMVDAPPHVTSQTVAIQARTSGSDQETIDRWLYFVSDTKATPSKSIGELAMVAIKGNGIKIVHVRRGYTRGTYNLVNRKNELTHNAEIAWASPVIWIKTQHLG